jgi:ribosomal protein S12 methylthiotransferase
MPTTTPLPLDPSSTDESHDHVPRRIHFVSLGCSKNKVDSEVMAALALGDGYALADEPDEAEVVVVNTCGFIDAARKESVNTILELAELKRAGNLDQLIVTGCLLQRYPKDLPDLLPEVDHFLGTAHFKDLPKILSGEMRSRVQAGDPNELHTRDPDSVLYSAGTPRLLSGLRHSAYLKISEGCSNLCTFCSIPLMRGTQMSRPVDDLVADARNLVARGVREINLIAQDLTGYGHDLKPRAYLHDLLAGLSEIEGLTWVRMLYAYPRSFSDELIRLMATSPKIAPYLDMPVQHIDDDMLRAMRRGGDGDKVRALLRRLQNEVPGIALRTTFIVGFPGETDAQFETLCDFVREFEFDHMGVFAYSREMDTPSGTMPGQVLQRVKDKRRRALMRIQRDISRRKLKALVGKTATVMVDGAAPESEHILVGRLATQAPDIDGVVYLTDLPDPANPPKPGTLIPVEIQSSGDYDLVAKGI